MEYLVLAGIRDLNETLSNMSENISNHSHTSIYKKDFEQIYAFSKYFFNGELDYCNILAAGFDTAVRETIPTSVWELLGNGLIHEKDRKLKQDNLSEVKSNVQEILIKYKNNDYEAADKFEKTFFNNFSNTEKVETEKELLIKCLKKLQQLDDKESKDLVKKLKNKLF